MSILCDYLDHYFGIEARKFYLVVKASHSIPYYYYVYINPARKSKFAKLIVPSHSLINWHLKN